MSNFSENLENAPQRAILKAVGFSGEDLEKPLIGILSAHNPMMPGHSDLDRVAESVKTGILSRGGVPVVLPVSSICGGLASGHGAKFCLPARDLTADFVETVAAAHALDGLVLLGSCEKTVAGLLLGAVRAGLPAILVGSGPARASAKCGECERKGFSDVLKGVGGIRAGKLSKFELEELEESACAASGTCEGMCDSINAAAEALGLSLPGNADVPSGSVARFQLARRTGETIVRAVADQLTPKKIVTLASVKNAIAVNMALIPSENAHLHLLAIANALGINLEKFLKIETINLIASKTPLLADLRPCGSNFIEDFHAAGGTGAVVKLLIEAGLADGSCLTVTGQTLAELCGNFEVKDQRVIRSVSDPLQKTGGLAVLSGNLAERGALVKRAGVSPDQITFAGPARVFDSVEDAAIAIGNGRISAGDCVVVRFEGPKGGPGMREITPVLTAIHGANLENRVAVVTDGRVPACSSGLNVSQVTPEAYGSNPLALLRDDDIVEIDLKKIKLAVKLSNRELEQRRKKLHSEEKSLSGLLNRYKERVTDAGSGAVVE